MKWKIGKRACVVILAFSVILAGCSGNGTVVNYKNQDENVTSIKFFGNKYEAENVTVIEEIISAFMEENPGVRVSYESLKGEAYYEALEKRMALHKGSDVFMVNHDMVLKLTKTGQLADLSGLETISKYTDSMLNQMNTDGKIYWLPTSVSAFGLYCNKDLLKKYHKEIPENLSEFEDLCNYFKNKGITPIIANNDISLKTLAIGAGFYSIYQENKQDEVFRQLNNETKKMSDFLYPGFTLAKEFIDKGFIDAKKALDTKKTSDDLAEFVKGEAPFMLTGAWAVNRVKGMNPGFKFTVIPYPIRKDGSLLVINPDTRLCVNEESEHKELAFKFVEYFTRADNIQKFDDQQSSFSPLIGNSDSAIEEIQPLRTCYQSGRTVIGSDAMLNLPIWDTTAEASKQLLSGKDLDEVMSWMDEQAAKGELQSGS